MCRSVEHAQARVRLALRMADVIVAKRVDPEDAAEFGPTGRHAIACFANPGKAPKKVEVPSDACWVMCIEIARHAVRDSVGAAR